MRWSNTCTLALALLGTSGTAYAQNGPVWRPCRGDSFYVDVPVARSVPWSNLNFLSSVAGALQTEANVPFRPWFCGAGAITCPTGQVTVDASGLLQQRTDHFREDGHLRFSRIRFRDASGTDLVVRPGAACVVVSRIRSLVALHAGVTPDSFYAGRECDAKAMGVEGSPSPEMLAWHALRMGLPASAIDVSAPDSRGETVELGLVDTGVIKAVSSAIGVSSEHDTLPAQLGYHGHGTGMAIFTRQVAPSARLRSTRVLDAAGNGTSASLAVGLDELIFTTADPELPLVVNLSLGWPSELARASRITQGSGEAICSSWEDPFGEAVRYVLDAARRLDDAGERRIFVSAATGNQPYPTPPSLFPQPPSGWVAPSCSPQSIPGATWFYPAHWDRLDSCRGAGGVTKRLAFGVGIADDRDLETSISIPAGESPLIAYGQHVYAKHDAAPVTPSQTTPQCGSTSTFPPLVTLPRTFSGTSVGSAFVSAAAARAQAARIDAGADPFAWNVLARVLYLGGRNVCRVTPAGAPVRILDIARLDHLLADPACAAVISCAESVSSNDAVPANLRETCKYQLHACGLEQLGPGGLVIESCERPTAVTWPTTYTSPTCYNRNGLTSFLDAALCGGSCPFATGSYKTVIGSLGPKPGDPACPDCLSSVYRAVNVWTVYAQLSANFPSGTTFTTPILIFTGPDAVSHAPKTSYVNLLSVTNASDWGPGKYLRVTGTLNGVANFDWRETKATLSLDITQPGSSTVKDYSALRLTSQ